jgi:hypothetical protein
LRESIASGQELHKKADLSNEEHQSWLSTTQTCLEMAFGEGVRQIGEFLSAGPPLEMMRDSPQARRIWQQKRLDTVAAQIQALQGFIKTLEIKASLLAPTPAASPIQHVLPTVRIFISHSSKDRVIAEKLADLLKSALTLSSKAIRCTSVDGYKLDGGAHVSSTLKHEVESCETLLGVLSPASLDSLYVAFELGARWVTNKPFIPLRARGFTQEMLKGPLTELHCLDLTSSADVHGMIAQIAKQLGVDAEPAQQYQRQLDAVLGADPSTVAASTSSTPSRWTP